MEVLLRMKENADLVRRYRDYELEEERTEKGIRNEIRENAIKEAKQEMVLAMYTNNEPFDKIQKYSGLSQEEIEEIINNSKSK